MSKAVLMSIQPYWVFLIIAKAMGWNIDKEKTVEVRKSRPKAESWNKVAKIYCSKDKKSFAKIPKEYQPFMKPLLGKVIGEFVCDRADYVRNYGDVVDSYDCKASCLTAAEIIDYAKDKNGNFIYTYGWHISNLIIYDKPKELSEFRLYNVRAYYDAELRLPMPTHEIKRPPQSWFYVEEV